MVNYSEVLDELRENIMNAGVELHDAHWDNAKQALAAVSDGRTKENQVAKMVTVGLISVITCSATAYWQTRKLKKSYMKREAAWRQIFDSSLRITDILQSPELSAGETDKKVTEELEFIEIIQKEWGFEK